MKNKKGFTLVEILAVIAIIAILAIVATVGVTSMIQKQRQKLAYTAEENISEAAQSYFSNKNVNYMKSCTDASGAFITISQKNIDDANKFLRDTKFAGRTGESLYQLYKSYSINGNSDPANKYELDPYIKVKNRACYKLVTVGELIEQGLINDADGMCNKSSMVVVYRKADAKNTAGIMTSIQESGICKSTRKTESGPVVTISPPSNLGLSSSKSIEVIVTTETTKLKSSFTMQYGWSKDEMIKPTSWSDLNFSGNTESKGSATINVSTLNETRYLWIKAGTVLDNKNNKTSNMKAGPYAFLPTVFVRYDVNTGDTSSCPASKTVIFTRTYGKDINGNEAKLCTPTKTGYDFKGWYRDGSKSIIDSTTVDIKIDHPIVAKWEPHVYTITLDKNLATNDPTSSINVTFDSTTLNPSTITVPKRVYTVSGFGLAASRKSNGATVSSSATLTSNYTFNGWTTEKNGSTILISNSTTPALQANVSDYTNSSSIWKKAADVTAYAKWTSAAVTFPTISKTGYDCGWTTSATGTTKTNNSGSSYTPTSSVIMYGVCTPYTFTIAYNCNGGTGTMSSHSCEFDQNCLLKNNTCAKSNAHFTGWKLNNTGSLIADKSNVKNATSTNGAVLTYYAQWACNTGYHLEGNKCVSNKPTKVTITYDLNGGSAWTSSTCPSGFTLSNGQCTKTFDANSKYGSFPTPKLDRTIHVGWTTTPNGTTKVTKTDSVGTTSKTIYAKWVKPYLVTKTKNNKTNQEYTILQEAINNVKSGEKIYLQSPDFNTGEYDDPDGATVNENKTFTINLRSYTLKLSKPIVINKGDVTFTNGTLYTNNTTRSGIEVNAGKVYISSNGTQKTTIKNTFETNTATGTEAIKIDGGEVHVSGKQTTITSGTGAGSGYARVVQVNGSGKFYMSSGTLLSNATKSNQVGGTVISANGNSYVNISGGTLRSNYISKDRCVLCTHNNAKIIFSGGTAFVDKAAKIEDDFGFVLNAADKGSYICYKNTNQFSFGKSVKLCDSSHCEDNKCKGKNLKWKPTNHEGENYLINKHPKDCS